MPTKSSLTAYGTPKHRRLRIHQRHRAHIRIDPKLHALIRTQRRLIHNPIAPREIDNIMQTTVTELKRMGAARRHGCRGRREQLPTPAQHAIHRPRLDRRSWTRRGSDMPQMGHVPWINTHHLAADQGHHRGQSQPEGRYPPPLTHGPHNGLAFRLDTSHESVALYSSAVSRRRSLTSQGTQFGMSGLTPLRKPTNSCTRKPPVQCTGRRCWYLAAIPRNGILGVQDLHGLTTSASSEIVGLRNERRGPPGPPLGRRRVGHRP